MTEARKQLETYDPVDETEVYPIRRENLNTLVTERSDGKRRHEWAKILGMSKSTFSHYLSGYRDIKAPVARQIDKAWGMEMGWLDHRHPKTYLDPMSQQERQERAISAVETVMDRLNYNFTLKDQRKMLRTVLDGLPGEPFTERQMEIIIKNFIINGNGHHNGNHNGHAPASSSGGE